MDREVVHLTPERAAELGRALFPDMPSAAALLLATQDEGSTEEARLRAKAALLLAPEALQRLLDAPRPAHSLRVVRRQPTNGDDAEAEKEPDAGPRHYLISAPAFLAVEDAPVEYVVGELLPAQVLALLHGEPRTRKSWAALELAIAAATGTPAFGLERFATPRAVPVLYSSQEDDQRRVRDRVRRFMAGRCLGAPPETLFFSVHAGINLEEPSWQAQLVKDVLDRRFRLVIFDPIRRYSPNVDKGPSEVREVTGFIRRLIVETGCTVLTVNHDVKPPQAPNGDQRRRGHRASGGDWFAAAEAPIALEPAGRDRTLVIPEDFKHGEDPRPFTFSIEEDEGKAWVRLVGVDVEAHDVGAVALHERIVEYLGHSPGSSGNAVAKGIKAGKGAVLEALQKLAEADRVDSVEEGRAVRWFLRCRA